MNTILANLRYALRQFRQAPIFTATAILTLALGIGGTTAIFTLIHAIMLRSLPVADPATLYRVGEGDDCCVEGGPQDNWGMYSYASIPAPREQHARIRSKSPHSRPAAGTPASAAKASKPLAHSAPNTSPETISPLLASVPSAAASSPRKTTHLLPRPSSCSATAHGKQSTPATPSVIGATFVVQGHPFTVVGVAPPGFFGETLDSDPPDIWIPLQQEANINGETSLVRQSISAWLRVIGRLKPGATVDGMCAAPHRRPPRLVDKRLRLSRGVWMPDVIRMPAQAKHQCRFPPAQASP